MFAWNKEGLYEAIAKLVSGNIAAQAINVLTIPLLTRLFAPDDYGLFAYFTSITLIVSPTMSLAYQAAIPVAKEQDEAHLLFWLSIFSLLATCIPLFLLISCCGGPLHARLQMGHWSLGAALFLMIVANGAYLCTSGLALRQKAYSSLSLSRIVETAYDRTLVLCLGFGGLLHVVVLMAGRIVGVLGATLHLLCASSVSVQVPAQDVNLHRLLQTAGRYRDFPLFYAPSSLINDFSRHLPVLMLPLFFPDTIVGWYALCDRVLAMPMSLVGDGVSRAYLQRAGEMNRKGESLVRLSESLFERLLALSLGPMVMVALVGDDLCSFVFGEAWRDAGTFLRALCFMSSIVFVVRPFASLFSVLDRQKMMILFDGLLGFVRFSSLLIGGLFFTANSAVAGYATASGLVFLSSFLWLVKRIEVKWQRLLVVFLKQSLFTLALAVVLLAIKHWVILPPAGLVSVALLLAVLSIGVPLVLCEKHSGPKTSVVSY